MWTSTAPSTPATSTEITSPHDSNPAPTVPVRVCGVGLAIAAFGTPRRTSASSTAPSTASIDVSSAAHRVHVAINELRKLGLGEGLLTDGTGYRLLPPSVTGR